MIKPWHTGIANAITNAANQTVRKLHIRFSQDNRLGRDTGINLRASTVREYFQGYKYVVTLPWRDESPDDMQKEIYCWLDENHIMEFTHNILRVSSSYHSADVYVIDEMGGGDLWFWAFKNERDAMLFALRW